MKTFLCPGSLGLGPAFQCWPKATRACAGCVNMAHAWPNNLKEISSEHLLWLDAPVLMVRGPGCGLGWGWIRFAG